MFSFEVVVANGRSEFPLGGVATGVSRRFEFAFDRAEARFHKGVVVAVARAAHALTDARTSQNRSVAVAGVLATVIAVVNCLLAECSFTHDSMKHLEDQFFGHVGSQIPSDDASRETVHQNGEV